MNYFAIGFGAVALIATGAIDYVNQAGKAGAAPGEFSASAYLDTFGARLGDVQMARAEAAAEADRDARRSEGARVFLPEAPGGWTRRGWLEGDNSALIVPHDDGLPDTAPALLKNLSAKSARALEERRASQSWVYQRGDRLIALRAEYSPRDDVRSVTDAAEDMLAAHAVDMRAEGWAVIEGVAFGRSSAPTGEGVFISQAGTSFDAFVAPMGLHDTVRLSVASNADEDDLRALLARIDYDGLNGLLEHPLLHVGSDAPDFPPEAEAEVADILLGIHRDLMMRRSADAMAWIERATTPENAMKLALNEVAAGWGVDGVIDLDPGALPEDAPPGPETSAQTAPQPDQDATSSGSIAEFAKSLFGGGSGGEAAADPPAKPGRLTLSGGTSCLEGSSGRFCRD